MKITRDGAATAVLLALVCVSLWLTAAVAQREQRIDNELRAQNAAQDRVISARQVVLDGQAREIEALRQAIRDAEK